jgi:CheY-like chemotaxis protein
MDGRTAAREIRKLEAKLHENTQINPLRVDGRIPIFAVSASLYESDRESLAENFDGWLLKPLGEFGCALASWTGTHADPLRLYKGSSAHGRS